MHPDTIVRQKDSIGLDAEFQFSKLRSRSPIRPFLGDRLLNEFSALRPTMRDRADWTRTPYLLEKQGFQKESSLFSYHNRVSTGRWSTTA